ncbi:S-layer homology domain-containing protein [Caryophanon latum]|uniref:SLH domain-containing protein n=1 Tax=Caryophanon latum TaxID=33977 RepID=A0A1C0YJP5_9BACL|nr:S-layer homology domain-containing protein [Caryophanon latum]OCS87299.1 hypothetical protein A6K76_02715 [Caryophanon latum]
MKKILTFLLMLTLLLSVNTSAQAADFEDIPAKFSFHIELDYLIERDIINGYPDGTFKPNALMAKKHIASMLVKALDLPTDNVKNPNYKDVPTSHPYYKEIAAAYTAGIFGDGTYFKPESHISRAFMAKILSEAFNLKSIADNAKTYKDVPQNHEFYRVIQLVSMNNIAQGNEIEDHKGYFTYTYNFNPNQLLTRAHFSAFLARAMSLRTGDYLPDKNYVYISYHDGYKVQLKFSHYDYEYSEKSGLWEQTVYWTNGEIENYLLAYGAQNGQFFLGYYESEGVYYTSYPFTIGLKYDTLHEEDFPEKQEIVETSANVMIEDELYNDVVVVRYTLHNWIKVNGEEVKDGYSSSYMYIAKQRGIIGFSDEPYENIESFFLERVPVSSFE